MKLMNKSGQFGAVNQSPLVWILYFAIAVVAILIIRSIFMKLG